MLFLINAFLLFIFVLLKLFIHHVYSLRPYAIVEFKEPCGGTSNSVVCSSWMVGRDKVYWPNVTSAKIFKLLRERTDPDETRWQCYDCRLLGTAGRFCVQSCLVIYMCCSNNNNNNNNRLF